MRGAAAFVVLGVFTAGAAFAYPDGAPWGAAHPTSGQSCAACHADYEPAYDSDAISIEGLPRTLAAGVTYPLVLRLAPSDAAIAGFLLSASSGVFATSSTGLEVNESEVRSTEPLAAEEGAAWRFEWIAPENVAEGVTFYAAVNGANDDASPFGDIIHFRTFSIGVD